MAWPKIVLWFPLFGTYNAQHIERLRQDGERADMAKAENVIHDPVGDLVTSPGFGEVRSTAITGAPAITGMFHMGDLANEFVLTADDGKFYRDTANPPGELTGGTAFATGADVLARGAIFNDVLLVVSRSRNIPKRITSAMSSADLTGTPARGVDVKAFSQRVVMFSPSDGTTTYRHLASFNSADNDETAWTTPYTTYAINFGKIGGKMNILGGEYFQDHLMAFSEDNVFPIYQTNNASIPMAFQQDILNEEGGGPASIHGVVSADGKLFWISRNFDVKMMDSFGKPRSIGYPVQPFLRGLNADRLDTIVGGFEPKYRCVIWALSDGTDTQNNDCLLYFVDAKAYTRRTLSRNAFANRIVSGEIRLIGGGYAGKFYNEFTSATTGDLDNAASAIDADIQGPRHHLGLPGVIKRGVIMAVVLDPIGSEVVTVQGNIDDETAFTTLNTTVTLSGTDQKTSYFRLPPFEYFQPRFKDANSGERFRVLKYGFSRPTSMYSKHT